MEITKLDWGKILIIAGTVITIVIGYSAVTETDGAVAALLWWLTVLSVIATASCVVDVMLYIRARNRLDDEIVLRMVSGPLSKEKMEEMNKPRSKNPSISTSEAGDHKL